MIYCYGKGRLGFIWKRGFMYIIIRSIPRLNIHPLTFLNFSYYCAASSSSFYARSHPACCALLSAYEYSRQADIRQAYSFDTWSFCSVLVSPGSAAASTMDWYNFLRQSNSFSGWLRYLSDCMSSSPCFVRYLPTAGSVRILAIIKLGM